MDTKQANAAIGRAADQEEETLELFSQKIDRATRCAQETDERIRPSTRQGTADTNDRDGRKVAVDTERLEPAAKDPVE